MQECLVIGRTGVGKTAFVLNFAEYLGLNRVEIVFRYPDGFSTKQSFGLDVARRELVGRGQHQTRCLQAIELDIPAGKAKHRVLLTDSSGLADGIPEEESVRRAIAQTLREIRQAALVLHILDAASPNAIGEVDRQVAHFAESRGGYLILANKMDLSAASDGLERIRACFTGHLVLPISAEQKNGLKEVRAVVARNL